MLIVASLATATSGQGPDCVEEGDLLGESYRGDVAVMTTGQVCQRWDVDEPNSRVGSAYLPQYPDAGLDENYCRNPDGSSGGPWCFNSEGTNPVFGSCTVPVCVAEDSDQGDNHDYSHAAAMQVSFIVFLFGVNMNI